MAVPLKAGHSLPANCVMCFGRKTLTTMMIMMTVECEYLGELFELSNQFIEHTNKNRSRTFGGERRKIDDISVQNAAQKIKI